jgi:hypothetical protein
MIDVQRLWLAVLMQAINDFTYSYEHARLKPWFTSDNRDPGSFKWICDHLELDSSRLRRRIFAIIDAPVSKHLHSTLARVSEAELKALLSRRGIARGRTGGNSTHKKSRSWRQTASAFAPGINDLP